MIHGTFKSTPKTKVFTRHELDIPNMFLFVVGSIRCLTTSHYAFAVNFKLFFYIVSLLTHKEFSQVLVIWPQTIYNACFYHEHSISSLFSNYFSRYHILFIWKNTYENKAIEMAWMNISTTIYMTWIISRHGNCSCLFSFLKDSYILTSRIFGIGIPYQLWNINL